MKKISLVLLLGLLPFCTGCQGLLLTTMVLLKGTDIDPKYDFLLKDKKKVVVVCQSRAMDQYRNPTAPRASVEVTIIGSISGVSPTATDSANSAASHQSPLV